MPNKTTRAKGKPKAAWEARDPPPPNSSSPPSPCLIVSMAQFCGYLSLASLVLSPPVSVCVCVNGDDLSFSYCTHTHTQSAAAAIPLPLESSVGPPSYSPIVYIIAFSCSEGASFFCHFSIRPLSLSQEGWRIKQQQFPMGENGRVPFASEPETPHSVTHSHWRDPQPTLLCSCPRLSPSCS